MKKVLIIGSTGSIGTTLTTKLINNDNYQLTLFARFATKTSLSMTNGKMINGDVLNPDDLKPAVAGQDVVFIALSGPLAQMATAIVTAVTDTSITKLILISSMGIYNEIPASVGANGNLANNPFLQQYRDAADIVTDSGINYTIIRPGWFDNGTDDYEVTGQNEPFGGHNVSRSAIVDLVVKLIDDNNLYANQSIGINRP